MAAPRAKFGKTVFSGDGLRLSAKEGAAAVADMSKLVSLFELPGHKVRLLASAAVVVTVSLPLLELWVSLEDAARRGFHKRASSVSPSSSVLCAKVNAPR